MEAEPRQQVAAPILVDDSAQDFRVSGNLRLANKRRAVAPANPDNNGTAAANPLCCPRGRRALNQYRMVGRDGEPDWRRFAAIGLLAGCGKSTSAACSLSLISPIGRED
jgi:hypothetical protein